EMVGATTQSRSSNPTKGASERTLAAAPFGAWPGPLHWLQGPFGPGWSFRGSDTHAHAWFGLSTGLVRPGRCSGRKLPGRERAGAGPPPVPSLADPSRRLSVRLRGNTPPVRDSGGARSFAPIVPHRRR